MSKKKLLNVQLTLPWFYFYVLSFLNASSGVIKLLDGKRYWTGLSILD